MRRTWVLTSRIMNSAPCTLPIHLHGSLAAPGQRGVRRNPRHRSSMRQRCHEAGKGQEHSDSEGKSVKTRRKPGAWTGAGALARLPKKEAEDRPDQGAWPLLIMLTSSNIKIDIPCTDQNRGRGRGGDRTHSVARATGINPVGDWLTWSLVIQSDDQITNFAFEFLPSGQSLLINPSSPGTGAGRHVTCSKNPVCAGEVPH